MALPTTRNQFKDYILRRLGNPVNQINVDDEQVEDRIDDALSYFRDYHYDGTEKIFMKHQITQQDIDRQYIELPEVVISVLRVLPIYAADSSSSLFSVQYHMALSTLWNLADTSIIPYNMAMMRIADIQEMFDTTPSVNFVKHKDHLMLNDWRSITKDSWVVLEVYRYLDPSEYTDVWADRWLLKYATQLVKKQWGENIKTFGGIQILNGITLDGKQIYDEAVEELTQLEEKMITGSSRPLEDRIG